MELNHRLLDVSQASCPLDDGTEFESGQGGSRTHIHQALDLTAFPILRTWPSSGSGSRTRPPRLMRPR